MRAERIVRWFGLAVLVAGGGGFTACGEDQSVERRAAVQTETVAASRAAVTTGTSTISSNFNGTGVGAGSYRVLSASVREAPAGPESWAGGAAAA